MPEDNSNDVIALTSAVGAHKPTHRSVSKGTLSLARQSLTAHQTKVTSCGIQFSDVFDIPLFHACC